MAQHLLNDHEHRNSGAQKLPSTPGRHGSRPLILALEKTGNPRRKQAAKTRHVGELWVQLSGTALKTVVEESPLHMHITHGCEE